MSISRTESHRELVNIVIPAYNEERFIRNCITSILNQNYADPMKIVVVANGCTDNTARAARSMTTRADNLGVDMMVMEIGRANKANALNAGDSVCSTGIRVYVDADVVLSTNSISAIVSCFHDNPSVHLTCPRIVIAPPRSGVIRRYASVWSNLTYIKEGTFGCGVYAVSEVGRKRWCEFPDLVSDDGFVRGLFSSDERQLIHGASFVFTLPERWQELIWVSSRWERGRRELASRSPQLTREEKEFHFRVVGTFLRKPRLLLDLPVFLFIHVLALITAMRRHGLGTSVWERASR